METYIGNIVDWKHKNRLETKFLDWKHDYEIGNKIRRLETLHRDWKQIRLETYYIVYYL